MFASRYYEYMSRRQRKEDLEAKLRRTLWYTDPTRYNQLFAAGVFADLPKPEMKVDSEVDTDEDFQNVDDLDEYDRYFDQLEDPHSMTGAEVFALQNGGDWV